MRAVRIRDGGVAVEQVAEPEGDGVRVSVVSAGICGSDLHLIDYGLPVTLGHEVAGTTADGRAVALQPMAYCLRCDRCLAGQTQLCRESAAHMLGVSADGGMADEVLVDPACLVPLPSTLGPADACLAEPVAVALHAVHVGAVETGSRVAVVGGGMIGLGAVAAARSAGADVGLEARHPHQRAAGERLGAGIGPSGEHDVVIEAAGTGSALDRAVELTRPGGTVVVAGTYWGGLELTAITALTMKEIRLQPAYTYGHHHGEREMEQAARLLAQAPELADTLVTHRFPLDEAPEAFRVAADRASGAIKVVLEP